MKMKMRKIITTVCLMALVSPAFAADCTLFTEDQKMTLKGMIVQTAIPEDESDKMYPSLMGHAISTMPRTRTV
jgi:hypothetical protein